MFGLVFLVLAFASVNCLELHAVPLAAGVQAIGEAAGGKYFCDNANTKCYYLSVPGGYTYKHAEQICAALNRTVGFSLPVPKTMEENAALGKIVGRGQFWLGISDKGHEGVWHSDIPADRTSTLTYKNFYNKGKWPEPNGLLKGVCVFANEHGNWFDSVCNTFQQFVICERHGAVPPSVPASCHDMPGMEEACSHWHSRGKCSSVTHICERTCNACKDRGCMDHPSAKFHCPLYNQFNACHVPNIAKLCPKTCGNC